MNLSGAEKWAWLLKIRGFAKQVTFRKQVKPVTWAELNRIITIKVGF